MRGTLGCASPPTANTTRPAHSRHRRNAMTTMSHNEWAISFEPNAHGRISISHETRPGSINVDIEDLILASGFDVEIWDRGHQAIQSTCFARFVELNDMQHVLSKEDWAPMGLTTLMHQGW